MRKTFPLETLLKVRKQKVKIMQADLFNLLSKNHLLEKKKKEIEAEIEELAGTMRKERVRGELNLQATEDRYLQKLHASLEVIIENMVLKEQALLAKRSQLNQAFKEKKVVEKLKEKHFTLLNEHEEKKERALHDEIAQRYSSNRK